MREHARTGRFCHIGSIRRSLVNSVTPSLVHSFMFSRFDWYYMASREQLFVHYNASSSCWRPSIWTYYADTPHHTSLTEYKIATPTFNRIRSTCSINFTEIIMCSVIAGQLSWGGNEALDWDKDTKFPAQIVYNMLSCRLRSSGIGREVYSRTDEVVVPAPGPSVFL